MAATNYTNHTKQAALTENFVQFVEFVAPLFLTDPKGRFMAIDCIENISAYEGTEVTLRGWVYNKRSSGKLQFILLRDGQEVAQVPEKPVGKFGRPLFQSMTYHDTPSQPLPEMRYLDASASPGEKHTYSIITVNSVGLKSEPSAPSS